MREVLWKMTEEEAIALQATVDEVLALAVEKQSQMPRRVVPRPTCKNAAVPEMVDKSAIQPFIRLMSSTAMEPRLR